MNILQALQKTAKLLNSFSVAGVPILPSDSVNADYRYRAVSLIDTAQKELCAQLPLYKTAAIAQKRLKSLVEEVNVAHIEASRTYEFSRGASLTFMADGKIRVSVQKYENAVWTELKFITTQKNGIFSDYKMRFEPFEKMRVLFENIDVCEYVYIGNLGIYSEKYDKDDDIPPNIGVVRHPIPKDYYRFESIDFSKSALNRCAGEVAYSIGFDTIAIHRDFDGIVLLTYRAMCQTIDDTTAQTAILDLPDDMCQLIPYYTAAVLVMEENPHLSEQLMSIYRSGVMNLDAEHAPVNIENDYYRGGMRSVGQI